VAMAAWLLAPLVDMPLERVALQGMALLAELDLGRTALLAVLPAEVVATARCRMLALGRESTSRRPPTSMLVLEVTSTSCGRGEILLASSRAAVC